MLSSKSTNLVMLFRLSSNLSKDTRKFTCEDDGIGKASGHVGRGETIPISQADRLLANSHLHQFALSVSLEYVSICNVDRSLAERRRGVKVQVDLTVAAPSASSSDRFCGNKLLDSQSLGAVADEHKQAR